MKLFPGSASVQLELDKIKLLLLEKCRSEYAKSKCQRLRIHTKKEFIDIELKQAHEFKQLLQNTIYFPNDYVLNLSRELKLLGIEGSVLNGEEFVSIRKLVISIEKIFRWFDAERRKIYTALAEVIEGTYYEKEILSVIDIVVNENGAVKDNASNELQSIRLSLYKKRIELRRVFDRIISKLKKQGYLADIEESFMSGRRVVGVYAEQKRIVKGILHGESDSRRTAFVEPEETIELNNGITELENAEGREVYKILKELTGQLAPYASLLHAYHSIIGEYDFIHAKAQLAVSIKGEYPMVVDKALVHLINACHPLLYIQLKVGETNSSCNSIIKCEQTHISNQWPKCRWQNSDFKNSGFTANDGAKRLTGSGSSII
ncbi:MAG: hypothetical protein ABR502_09875 [Chitinophagaceae bacterium]